MGLFSTSQPKGQASYRERREPAYPAPHQHYNHGGLPRQSDATVVARPPAKQQRPPNGFANENPQMPGQRPQLQIQLDPNFRAAGKKSALFGAFVQAHDKVSRGQV
ncbi:hypothetical protein MGN70_009421 [Eutypa lata]|nr:hypothetical protein MGN70_009421 [Eutypa lata]